MRPKISFGILLSVSILLSCQSVGEEDYRQAAQETCLCVANLKTEQAAHARPQNDGLRYALCTLEMEGKFNIDVQDEAFVTALKKHCPEMYKVHENVVNNSLQLQNQTPK